MPASPSPSCSSSSSSTPPPTLSMTLTPHHTPPSPHISSLSIRMTIPSPRLATDAILVTLSLSLENIPSQHSSNTAIRATDDSGALPLRIHNTHDHRNWRTTRPTTGDVTLTYRARPRDVHAQTPLGARVDLRAQHGGLLGSGLSFIPVPPDTSAIYTVCVCWDLSGAAAGTRGVWTFGEGPGAVRKVGPASVVANGGYAVGAVESWPLTASSASLPLKSGEKGGRGGNEFGVCYFGHLPRCIAHALEPVEELFRHMSTFFRDPCVNPYRIFVRDASPARGFGGTALIRSVVFEYDGEIESVSEDEVFVLLAHEMVHNWPLMVGDARTGWFSEGIAEFYACFLPGRVGIRGKEWMCKVANGMLSAYYTNPLVRVSNEEAAERTGETAQAGRLAYKRGFTYLVKVDYQLREGSKGEVSLDDIVYALLEKKGRGEPCGVQQWLELVESHLGHKAVDEYHAMAAGELVVPAKDCLKHEGLRLVRMDQEVFQLGFQEESLNERVIVGLEEGSRAQKAGLREGDRVLRNGYLWQVGDQFEREMRVVVSRAESGEGNGKEGMEGEREKEEGEREKEEGDGEEDGKWEREVEIRFWPRGWENVECWQWVID